MKTVFQDISKIAHLWANQQQNEAKTPKRHYFFEGKTIYSYGSHFPIAVISDKNSNDVFFTTRTYSVTTSGQISVTRQACSHKTLIYCKNPDQAARGEYHNENLEDFEDKAKEISTKLARANKPEKYLVQIAEQRSLLEKYCIYFSLSYLPGMYPFTEIKSKTGASEASEVEKIQIELQRIESAKRLKVLTLAEIKKFRAFKTNYVYNSNYSYLRYNKETKRIETSQRVEIPTEAARRFYLWMQNNTCTDCTKKLLEYEVKDVNDKTFRIGCHLIERKEANKIAKLLNW